MADDADIAAGYQERMISDALLMRPKMPQDGNGVCKLCDTTIDPLRLKHLPGTRYCRICAGAADGLRA